MAQNNLQLELAIDLVNVRVTALENASYAPSGPAGGGLSGTYPNPSIATGLDAAKIADGSVSNTEFQYLSTVTSNVQTQLDAKAAEIGPARNNAQAIGGNLGTLSVSVWSTKWALNATGNTATLPSGTTAWQERLIFIGSQNADTDTGIISVANLLGGNTITLTGGAGSAVGAAIRLIWNGDNWVVQGGHKFTVTTV